MKSQHLKIVLKKPRKNIQNRENDIKDEPFRSKQIKENPKQVLKEIYKLIKLCIKLQ